MAKSGGSAGIYGYRIDTSEIVLATSVVQLLYSIIGHCVNCANSKEALFNPFDYY